MVAEAAVAAAEEKSRVGEFGVDLGGGGVVEHHLEMITPATYMLAGGASVVLGFGTEFLHCPVVRVPSILEW